MGTDRIDVYFIHRFDDRHARSRRPCARWTTWCEQGKILYPAASNFAAWQVDKGAGHLGAGRAGARSPCIQPMYNLVKRQAEVEILPMAQAETLGVIPYSPLGGGLLTGKYGPEKRPDSGRLVDNKMYGTRYGFDWMFETADRFTAFARERGFHPAAWPWPGSGSHPAVTAPIIGGRNVEQIEIAAASLDIDMNPN